MALPHKRRIAIVITTLLALSAACEIAHAQPNAAAETSGPPYTLEVESDEPDTISFEALGARIASDLGASVARPADGKPARAAISIRYRAQELTVRAVHAGGHVLERTVKAEGDAAAVQREAVLLASNLARDEAREILDSLAARQPPPPGKAPPEKPPEAAKPEPKDEGSAPFTFALVYPIAMNYGRPHIATAVDVSLLYTHVGTVKAVQIGSGAVHASRSVTGLQLAGAAAIAEGETSAAQISGGANVNLDAGAGTQIAGGANVTFGDYSGVRIAGLANATTGKVKGVEISGGLNLATAEMDGLQLSSFNVTENLEGVQFGVVNVARKVKGLQLGVINVTDKLDGAAIGVVSISRDGVHPIAWASNLHRTNVGVKFSNKYFYTIAGVNFGTLETDFDRVGTVAALGTNIPITEAVNVDVQAVLTDIQLPAGDKHNMWIAGHVLPGYTFAKHLRVFGGGGVRKGLTVDDGSTAVRPELMAGVQF